MEREILFRGKAINRDSGYYRTTYKNGDWVYGLLTQPYNERYDLPAEMTNTSGVNGIEVDCKTIGQFTGYCDESQHNAFEGDILSYCSGLNYGVIKYGRYSSPFSIGQDIGFYVEWVSDRDRNIHRKDLGYWLSAGTAEIVGNIYDNPELLKKE